MNNKTIHWEYKKIKDTMIQVIDGDRGKEYPKENEFLNEGYCLFLTANNITKNGFRLDNKIFISEVRDKKLGKGKLQLNDLILTTRGSVGNIALFNDTIPYTHIRINSGMVILRVNPKEILPDYLEILFSSGYVSRQITKVVYGSAQPQLTVKTINSIMLPIPDIKSQEFITSVINSGVNTIDKIDKLIEAKMKLKQALMHKLLTGQIRFPGFGKPVTKIGDIPKGWKSRRLSDLCSIEYGASWNKIKSDSGFPVYGTGGVMGYANKSISDKPAIIIGRKGTIDRPFYVNHPFWTVDTTFFAQPKGDDNLEFIYCQLCMLNWKLYNEASGLPSLNRNTISSIHLIMPLQLEQDHIAEALYKLNKEIEILANIKAQHVLQKQSLCVILFSRG